MSDTPKAGKKAGHKGRRGKKKSLPALGFADDLLKGPAPSDLSGSSEPPAPPAAAQAGSPAAGSPAASSPAASKPSKISLPAFGFAEDLLPPREPATPPREDAETPPAANPEDFEKDDRIFAFADRFDDHATEDEVKKVRLETWVTFNLAGEVFALPVEPIREILRLSTITRVPHAPQPIRGVTNLRGRVIPVIDLRLRIELPEGELTRSSRVVVVASRGRLLGLLVDAVHQVVHLDADLVQPPPEDVMTRQSDYIAGVYHMDEQLILLLDVDRALVVRSAVERPPHTATTPRDTETLDAAVPGQPSGDLG